MKKADREVKQIEFNWWVSKDGDYTNLIKDVAIIDEYRQLGAFKEKVKSIVEFEPEELTERPFFEIIYYSGVVERVYNATNVIYQPEIQGKVVDMLP